jgi:anti-sigma factor RsiW
MRCHDIERQLADWTAGILSEQQVAELQKHLLTCKACRERSGAFTSTLHALSVVYADEKPSPYFKAKVLARAEQTAAPQRSWRWVPVAGTAVVLLVTALAWFRPWPNPKLGAEEVVAGYENDLDSLLEAGDEEQWDVADLWTLPDEEDSDDEDWEAI